MCLLPCWVLDLRGRGSCSEFRVNRRTALIKDTLETYRWHPIIRHWFAGSLGRHRVVWTRGLRMPQVGGTLR